MKRLVMLGRTQTGWPHRNALQRRTHGVGNNQGTLQLILTHLKTQVSKVLFSCDIRVTAMLSTEATSERFSGAHVRSACERWHLAAH